MEPPVTSFWAKLKPYRGTDVEAWHPLPAHAADVAACTEALLRRTLLRRRLSRIGSIDRLTDVQIDRLCVLAALHDLGKYNVGFQNRRLENPNFTAGHVDEALAAFSTDAGVRIGQALRLPTLFEWGEAETTFEDLLVTALGHHGRPVSTDGRPTPGAWEPTDDLDPFEGLADLRERVERWYPRAFRQGGAPLPVSTRFQHAFNGLLTLADWLGSNEVLFPYAEDGDPPRIETARERAAEAVEQVGLDPSRARSGLVRRPPRFEDVWPFDPRPGQRVLEELPTETQDGSLTIFEAPTGSGKTEAALIRFLRLFAEGKVDGMYFALPTRAAATQMHGRVRYALEQVIPDARERPAVVHAVPGYLSEDEAHPALLGEPAALWPEEARRWRFRTWASERPKRYLAGTVVVGTVDQVLLSALAVDHSHLRASSLLRHFLVVDEVHASDAYMSRILETVLGRHLRAGGHALLMSATLGAGARHRYLELADPQDEDVRPLEQAGQFPYPVMVRAGPELPRDAVPIDTEGISDKEVAVDLDSSMQAPDDVARRALAAADDGARVLAIRNTVNGCRDLQRAVEAAAGDSRDPRLFRCVDTVAPHHSRFAAPDRNKLDEAIERAFGDDAPSRGVVLVATQTVEQSLDIDADLLITDLCPADVLLQRIGRLHRHDRGDRPEGFRSPRVVILVPGSRELGEHIITSGEHAGRGRGPHGIGTVYEDLRVLDATWSELRRRDTIDLPPDNRELVEAATHPEALERVVREKGGPWIDHRRRMDGLRRAEQGMADLNLADWSARFGDPASLFPDRPGERIRTRLGEDDRRAVLSRPVPGPFGPKIRELTLPAWMAPDAETGEEAEVLRTEEGRVIFRFGDRRYRYDRLGLRRAETSEEQGAPG